jgi:hypothetical protein
MWFLRAGTIYPSGAAEFNPQKFPSKLPKCPMEKCNDPELGVLYRDVYNYHSLRNSLNLPKGVIKIRKQTVNHFEIKLSQHAHVLDNRKIFLPRSENTK